MNRRDFIKNSLAIACSVAIPINVMATEHPFIEFAENNFKINHYKRGIIPWRATKHHKELAEIYDNERFVIVKKYRQGGFTTFTILRALYECLQKENQCYGIISRTWTEAAELKKMCDITIALMEKKPEMVKSSKHNLEFKNGNKIRFFNPTSARGCALTTVVLDECSFWLDLQECYAAIYPTISTGGKLFMVSTPNNKNYFWKLWNTDNEFVKYAPNYFEHPDYKNEEWVSDLRASLGEKGWKQECLAEFQDQPF